MATLPDSATRYQLIRLTGGLDILTPGSQLAPGAVRDALNWEASVTGGYARSGGYERHDGRRSPSSAQYGTVEVDWSAVPAVGTTINGAQSGTQAVLLSVEGDTSAYTASNGVFAVGEAMRVGSTVVGTVLGPGEGGGLDYNARMQSLAADHYREAIGPVPGSGPVRGVAMLAGKLYAWRDAADGESLRLHRAGTSGWTEIGTPPLEPGGRVQTDIGNFDGTPKLYGCDGVNKGFQFDGTSYTLITTGTTPDVPTAVLVHRDHLWFAFGDNLQNSEIGNPLGWTANGGSAAYRLDSRVTVLLRQPGSQAGGAMSVSTLASTSIMYGSSSADFKLVSFEESAGARSYGGQNIGGQSLLFGDLGVFALSTTQAYGNFAASTLTMHIRPWTQTRSTLCTGSLVSRERSQYRVFFGDGYALYTTIVNGKVVGSMPQYFPEPVLCTTQGELEDGREAAFFGSSNGHVYEIDAGTSHDGAPINAHFEMSFVDQGNNRVRKRYRGVALEVQGESFASFDLTYQIGYGTLDRPQGYVPRVGSAQLAVPYWDTATWDTSVWDGKTLSPTEIRLEGTGENISLRIVTSSALYPSFAITSMTLHYSVRKAAKA